MSPHRRPAPADPRVRALVAQAAHRGGTVAAVVPRRRPGHRRRRRAARRVRHRVAVRRPRRPRRTSPTATRSSAGPTGRSTSTRTTTGRATRRSRRSRQQSGIKATYAEDIDDNDTFYGKVSGQLKNGQDIGYDIVTLTDWMAARMIRLGYTQELDKSRMPNADEHPVRPGERRLRPGPHALPDVAVRLRRAGVGQGEGAGRAALAVGPVGPRAGRAASRCSPRCATRWA